MKITPLRNLVVVELRPEQGNGHRKGKKSKIVPVHLMTYEVNDPEGGGKITRYGTGPTAVRTGTVVAVGPECRDVTVGSQVVVNLLVASQVEDWYLVPENTILGTL